LKLVSWVTSQEPDVLMINEVADPRTAVVLAKFAAEGQGHKVYVALRANNTFEALGLWRRLVGDDHLAMLDLQMVLAGRVMRRLCMACKVAFNPDPDALRKLNMNPAKAATWFQARRDPLRDGRGRPIPCEFCHDLRYKGRLGVYEVMSINSEMKQAVESGASLNQLKAIFRKQRARFLQEVAMAQVESGETSVQEVLRVMQVVAEPGTATGSRGSGPGEAA
jgi:type II secretory ATPase GspE/PulE/Tfp pilus assembly ATPase PilB-like protein